MLVIIFFGFYPNFNKNIKNILLDNSKYNGALKEESSKLALAASDRPYEEIGIIPDRSGKIFSNISVPNLHCYINRDEPDLDNQPVLFLQGWNLTHANMLFENIYAINYTRDIETEQAESIKSYSETDPIYVYQKFSVKTDQYINNVSILIQDRIDKDNYTDENEWEVSIVNCSNDPLGTPNSNEILGTLTKPHPKTEETHWDVFDFKNSNRGPIFLDTSKTNSTFLDGIYKYWYALKIKIPPNDNKSGGGLKFLYLNPDGTDPDEIGEGETFAISPQFLNHSFFNENVIENKTILGENIKGNISSFTSFDENIFITKSFYNESNYRDYISVTVRLELDNLTNSEYTWEELKTIDIDEPTEWKNILNNYYFNISLVLNVNNSAGLRNIQLDLYNPDSGGYDTMTHDMILNSETEYLQNYTVIIPEEKLFIIQHINTSLNGNNSLIFRFYYDNLLYYYDYELSINLFNMQIEKINTIDAIQKYDPIIHKLYYSNNITSSNSSIFTPNDEILDSIKANDDNFLSIVGDSNSNTTSIEFEFSILTNLDSSLWDVDDPKDWILNLPNPIIPQIDFHISSNVSIQDSSDLALAALEIYNGGNFSQFAGIDWRQFLDNKTFADKDENTKVLQLDSSYTWYIMHLINESDNNSLRIRLRFIGNGGLKAINVSIDEFSLNFHVQNAISSDIASKIGFGLNSNSLKPLDIHLENWGTPISDEGVWDMDIDNGVPIQFVYSFNITSIWPEVRFDVSGIYSIEKYQDFDWNYYVMSNSTKILWNVSTDLSYYSYDNYNNIKESMSLQFDIPSDWQLMEIYNDSALPPTFIGEWYPTILSNNQFKTVTISNISDGIWIICMNSSKNKLTLNTNSTNTFIDKMIKTDINIQENYGGDVYLKIYNSSSDLIFSQTTTLNESSLEHSVLYCWDIFSTTKSEGTYYVKAYWILYNKTHAFLAINTTEIVVSKYDVILEILNIEELSGTHTFGSNIPIEGRLTNNETGVGIDGEMIIVKVYDKDQNLIDDSRYDITHNEGKIQIEYSLPRDHRYISIELVYNASGTYYSAGKSVEPLEINLISQSEQFIKHFLKILPYIGVILGIALATVVGLKYKKIKLKRFWAENATILDDLTRTAYIMIIHKDVGVPIFNKQISLVDINPSLISGFLHAISAFRSEIKMVNEGIVKDQGFEMDYYDFKIVITDGEYIRVALIIHGLSTEKLKENQKLFTEKFENRFKPELMKFEGETTPFKSADKLLEEIFNINLVFPLRLGELSKVIKVKGLEKALIKIAEEIQEDKNFFFVSRLISFASAGRKECRDEIINAILSLKEKGLIIRANL